jgi:hypothetical protein
MAPGQVCTFGTAAYGSHFGCLAQIRSFGCGCSTLGLEMQRLVVARNSPTSGALPTPASLHPLGNPLRLGRQPLPPAFFVLVRLQGGLVGGFRSPAARPQEGVPCVGFNHRSVTQEYAPIVRIPCRGNSLFGGRHGGANHFEVEGQFTQAIARCNLVEQFALPRRLLGKVVGPSGKVVGRAATQSIPIDPQRWFLCVEA